ncbi:MAG: response regulator transcription factor [Verrucomicrobiae bacterium]|nr:response regulator transcription factor [Verrucomicrobiae bacterium]
MKITVSIVEDDAPTRQILADWLRQTPEFALVSEHGSAETALETLLRHKPNIVMVDINLPGISGVECVRRLKPLMPETQFVMLTVYEDANHIFSALAAGATGYLLKQTTRDALIAALKDVHAGGSPMSSNIARQVVKSFYQPRPRVHCADDLSTREREVLELLASGYLYKEIAEALGISVPTVSTYIRRIYEKLHVRSRAQAVAKYTRLPGNLGAPDLP